MSGLLLTSDSVYGLVNPPPDPVDDLPETHQTIGSAAVRWDYFLDLSNNIGDHLVAGNNVTITGNIISVLSTVDSSGLSVSTSTVISRAKLTNVDLCNNRFIELTFSSEIAYLETYDLANFTVKQNEIDVPLGDIYVKDGKVNISLDYSANAVTDASSNVHLVNPNDISGQVYFETFNDMRHIGNYQTQGTYETGVSNIGYSKKGVSGEGLFNLTSSHMPNGVKAISFWVKDYECLQENWFLVSDISRSNGYAIELFVDSTSNRLSGYGDNLKKIYVDGNEYSINLNNTNLPFTPFDITPTLNAASFTGWHHVYIESKTTFADIELLSRDGNNNSLGSIDEIRMYNRALTTVEISGIAVLPYLNTIDNLTEVEIKYVRDMGTKDNLKIGLGDEIQQFIYYNGAEYYINDVLDYRMHLDLSLNTIVSDISDLSQNVNVRLQNLSTSMTESIVPVLTDVSLNNGTIELNFTKDISSQTTYDISNFTIRYNDSTQLYNTLNIENGNVVLKYLDSSGATLVGALDDVNKLEIAYRKDTDSTKNLVDLIGGGEINEFIYKGLGLTNINKESFTDLSDVSVNNIIEGQFVKYDGSHFVPTNDISDISQNLADEINRVDSDISSINTQLTALLVDAPATLDSLKEIADVLGDPTDASGGLGSILSKIEDISQDIQNLSTQSSGAVGDLSGQTSQAITDLSINIHNRIHTSDTNLTFFEIMTRQPSTFSPSGEVVSTAGNVEINWMYDNILANSTNTTLAKLAFQNSLKSKNIPFIDTITIEISGNINTGNSTYDNNSNSWITFTTGIWPKTFSSSEDYNTPTYKTLTINKVSQEQANSNSINNILSKTDPFDVRIYGTNYAENFPTVDNRSLYFNDLSFVTALAPAAPEFSSENAISSDSAITFVYYVTETELNNASSAGVLIDASNTYFDFETTSSAVSGIAITNTNIQTNTSISNVGRNTNYSIAISSLRAGTKYRFFTAARNNLTSASSYSANSTTITSSFTRLPSSTGPTPTSSWFTVSTYAYRISTPTGGSWAGDNLSNSSVRYLNKSNNDYLQLLNSTRTFEISLPYSSTQQNTEVGYGKFIDNSNNLTDIAFSIDGTEKQELVYGGFGVSPTKTNKNGNTVDYFTAPTTLDPYNGNNNRQGFRLNGRFALEDILHSNIGIPSSLGYSLNYTFDKHSEVGGNSISTTFKVYIDEITGNPTITRDGTETYVTALSYCMGIPSVETFDVSFNRSYSNVNSQHQYVRYHSSSPAGITVGLINSISKTNRSSSSYSGKINIDRTDISSNGSYQFNSTEIDTKTSNRFRDIYFTQSISLPTSGNQSPSDSISINELSFNLNGDANITNSQTINYYCDYASFNKSSSKITTPLISTSDLGEISNMGVFNTQLNAISTNNIANHETVLNDWTLLFINGRFRSNTSQRYPDVTGYTWTKPPGDGSFTTPLTYNGGDTAYYLNGSITGSGNKYKWIAFKFTESDATTATVSGIQYTYLNIYNLLSQNFYFSSTVLGYLKSSSNNNVIGFIQQTYNSAARIGNLSRGYSPSAIWYNQNAGDTFNNIFEGPNKSNYGCVFEENSTNWGPILDTTNGATNIVIYIGFNNDVSLS